MLLAGTDAAEAARLRGELERALGQVSTAAVASAQELRERLAATSWDAIVVDHASPPPGLAEVLDAVRDARPEVPVVVVSGPADAGGAAALLRLGARDCLSASERPRLGPVIQRELRDVAVRRALRESERARAQERIERELVTKQLDIIRRLGNDILLIVSLDGRIVEANDRAAAAYGYAIDELLRLNERDLRPEESRSELGAQIRAAVAQGGGRYTTWHRRRSGERFPVAVSARPIEVAGEVLLQSVIRDLTGERAARAAVEREALLVEHLSDAVIGLDRTLRVNAWNRAAERLFEVPRGEAIGSALAGLVQTELPGGRSFEDVARAAEERGAARFEVRQRARSGEAVDAELTMVAVRDPAAAPVGYVAVLHDITAQRRAWDEFVQAQKMEAVGRLASGVAHDFNNLLVSVLTNSEFLAESLDAGDPRRQDAVEIHQAGERAAQLVRQLLTFARRSPAAPVPTDLSAVIGGFERLLRRTIGEDVRIDVRLAAGPWPARIDPGNVEQIVMNLAVNARDAMPRGGTLRIETRNEELAAGAAAGAPPGRYAALVVEDDGAGIPPEVLPRIFEPFFTTKRAGQGTGLGLSTVHGIVEQARGRISVSSAPGRGTRFTILLPACEAAPEAESAAAADAAARGRGEQILLVEDDDGVRATLRRVLERNGYAVVEATNGREALDRFRARTDVALVLTDSVMPEGSGPALAAAIHACRPAVPVVLMSGYLDRERGPDPVVEKPFTAEALLVTVRRALEAPRGGR